MGEYWEIIGGTWNERFNNPEGESLLPGRSIAKADTIRYIPVVKFRDFIPIDTIALIVQHVIILIVLLLAGELIFIFIERFIGDWLSKDIVHDLENITIIFLIGWRAGMLIWEIIKNDFRNGRSLMLTYVF